MNNKRSTFQAQFNGGNKLNHLIAGKGGNIINSDEPAEGGELQNEGNSVV